MAQRRCVPTLSRHAKTLLSSHPTISLNHHSLKTLSSLSNPISLKTLLFSSKCPVDPTNTIWPHHHRRRYYYLRNFSSNSRDDSENEDDEDDDDEGEDDSEEEIAASDWKTNREYTAEEKEAEAASIGYKVVGPLLRSDRVFKPYEPVFAVVQVGSHQFKVSNGDSIFTERLKFCEVNEKLILNKVLLLGSSTQTIVGRPTVPDAAVHAVVEEHALDAKVIIFKKKRRKNYRRTKGHRQELTKLRITDIQGIEKPEKKVDPMPKKSAVKKQEKVPVAA